MCKWRLIFGGPCRGRTYGPLIKSEAEGVAEVFEEHGQSPCHYWRFTVLPVILLQFS